MSTTTVPAVVVERAARAAPALLSARAAFALQVSMLVSFLAGSSAPTPLYAVYQAKWGFSPITVTIVFAVYAVAVLTALLVAGSLSDHVGRRPVLLAATSLQAVTMLVFASAGGVSSLLAARIIQGVSTGLAAGALGAGLLDLDRPRGTIANAVAPMLGTATGGLASGLLVQYLPAPTHLIYLGLFAVFALQNVGVALMPETATRRPGAFASLRPKLRVPAGARQPLLLAAPALIASWSLAGFYLSLGPVLVRRIVGSSSLLLGGLAVLAMAGSGALAVLVGRARSARALMTFGAAALVAGVGATLAAVGLGSPDAVLRRDDRLGDGLRDRLPGRDPHRAPARGGARARGRAVGALRRLVPGDGTARDRGRRRRRVRRRPGEDGGGVTGWR